MCGICGVLNYGREEVQEKAILRMCREMTHRGPDDEGVYLDNNPSGPGVGLGHRRLKIIDLSEAGHQPMSNEDGWVWIVLNGEIYNFNELRVELQAKKHLFRSYTDTECVIHLYEEYGEECVKYLRGMFAFAIWDKRKRVLMLARDRVGKKPLLYHYKNNRFSFASEFCSLLAGDGIGRDINKEAVEYYLSFGYIPAPLTIYKDILKLPPAHILIFKNNQVTLKRYWELDYNAKIKISKEEAAQQVLAQLTEAVKIRMHSDVPLGAFLSGGIDSSSVVALMSQLSSKPVKTFSIGFDDSDYSELKFARKIADRFNTDHSEFIVKPEALKILPLLVERYGEPYADSSCVPTYYVSRQTKEFVTVALNGDGGDESFAGYDRYQAMLLAQGIPSFVRSFLGGVSSIIPDSINFRSNLRRLRRFLKGVALPEDLRYLKWVGILDAEFKESIYSDEFLKFSSSVKTERLIRNFFDPGKDKETLDTLLRADIKTYLPYDLLVKVDITSMANSLEARSPFLDHKLMEFAAKLPSSYKLKNSVKKYILKKAIRGLIPGEIIQRKKMGFGVPVGSWFRNELKPFLLETLCFGPALSRGYFKPEAVKRMVQLHIAFKADYSSQLWALLMLELWHRRFVD